MGKNSGTLVLKKKQLVILIGFFALILISASYLFFSYESDSIRAQKYNELRTIGRLKISQILSWNSERIADCRMLSENSLLLQSLMSTSLSKNSVRKSDLLRRIMLIQKVHEYNNIFVTDLEGRPLISSEPGINKLDRTTVNFIEKACSENNILNTGLFKNKADNKIYIDYIAPVSIGGKTAAAVVLRVDPESYLFPMINEWPNSSSTSETIIVRREGNYALYLNNHHFNNKTALNLKIPLTQTNSPAVKAVLGYKGILEGINYRGIKVLAYISPVPGTKWIMITKVDSSEIFSSLYFKEAVITSFTLLLMILISVSLFWYYHFSQRNIYKKLFEKEKELREYHKEFRTILYSIGDGVITTDKNGNIKQMNPMAEELTGWKESEAKDKFIENIFRIVNEESREKVENPVEKVLKSGQVIGLANHTTLINRHGKEILIADSGAPIRNEGGEIEGVVLVFRDKTYEYLTEKMMRESKARLNRAELVSKSGNWELHLETGTMFVSEGAEKIYGVNGKKFDLNALKNFPLRNYRNHLDDTLKKLVENGEPYDTEFKIKTRDTGKIIDIHSVAEYDKENKILFGIIQDVTQQKKIEAERVRLNEIIEKSLNEIYIFDAETLKFEYINSGASVNLGYRQDEIRELSPIDIKPLYSEKSFRKVLQPLLNGEKDTVVFETVHRRKDGSEYPVEAHHQLHQFGEKKVFFSIISDITLRKNAEKEVHRSRQILQLLVEYAPAAIAMFDPEMKYMTASKRYLKEYGLGEIDLTGKSHYDVFPEIPERWKEIHRRCLAGATESLDEDTFPRANGKLDWIRWEIMPWFETSGKIGGIILFSEVITEQKLARETLRESEERFRTIYNASPDGISISEIGTGLLIEVNEAYQKVFGFDKDEVIGRTSTDIGIWVNKDDRKIVIDELEKYGKYNNKEIKFRRKDGKIIHTIVSGNIISLNDKKYLLTIINDITELHDISRALSESEERNRTTLYSIGDGVIATDECGNVRQMNPIAEKLTGYSEKEARGRKLEEIFNIVNEVTRTES